MKTLSFRIPDEVSETIDELTRRWPESTDSEVYRRIIEEWARVQEHPGIRFVDGPAGRRAALVGGPDVWEVVVIDRDFGGVSETIQEAYPWLVRERLEAALSYAEAYPDEIERLIEENRRAAEELEQELELLVREDAAPGESHSGS